MTSIQSRKGARPYVLFVAMASLCISASAVRAQSGDAVAGKKTTEFVCRNCHDVTGNEKAKSPPGGAPSFFDVAQRPGTSEKGLHRLLTLPHGRMDMVAISGKEVDNVVAYIMSLRRK